METTGYFEASPGNKSSSRLISFIVIIWALGLATLVLLLSRDNIVNGAVAAGTLFFTIAGSAMTFMFGQKHQETKDKKQ